MSDLRFEAIRVDDYQNTEQYENKAYHYLFNFYCT